MKLLWLALVVALGCSDRDRPHAAASESTADRPTRVIDPPPQNVRALPPHAIRSDGVGPYKLGLTLEQLGTQIPSGGRNAQVEIPLVIHLSVLHAEEDAILIGGEPLGRATFVAVVGEKIARTESGVQVGSTRDELIHALGPPSVELDRARDPHVIVPSSLRELRAVMEGDRVVGLVVAASESPSKPDGCVRPTVDDKKAAISIDGTAASPGKAGLAVGACVTGAPEVVTLDGDELSVRAVDSDKVLGSAKLPNAVFVAPIRASDGHDELIAIVRTEDTQTKTWWLVAFRWEANHLIRVANEAVYQLTATNARWIGSSLHDLDLALEVVNRGDTFEVGGLLTRRSGEKLRDLLMLSPVQVARKRAKPATPDAATAPNATVGDAGVSATGSDGVH